MRGSLAVVICPKLLDEMLATGPLKLGWFSKLNASARAPSVTRSYSLKSRRDRRGIEAAWTDLPVWQRLPGGRIVNRASYTLGLAAGAVERAEVAGERRGGRNKRIACGGVLANIGLLKSTEEE